MFRKVMVIALIILLTGCNTEIIEPDTNPPQIELIEDFMMILEGSDYSLLDNVLSAYDSVSQAYGFEIEPQTQPGTC